MSIRVKLLILFLVLILVSTGLLVTAGVTMIAKGMSDAYSAVSTTQFDKTLIGAIDLLAELKYAERHAPQRLLDENYLNTLSSSTEFFKGGLAAKLGNKLIYSNGLPEDATFYDDLVPIPESSPEETSHGSGNHQFDDQRSVQYKDQNYFYIDYSFERPEGLLTYYFVVDVSDIKAVGKGARNSGLRVIVLLLIIIIGPLLWVITQDIIMPIRELEKGVTSISEGNLSLPLTSEKNNELGKVIRYFDAMRIKLKDSIETQIKMEENRKELLSSISHDLKTPITAIKGYVEGIRDGVANTPHKLDRYLQVIYDKSLYLDALVDDLFLFSKLDLQKLPFDRQEVALSEFIKQLFGRLNRSLTEENQKLDLIWPGPLQALAQDIFLNVDMRHMDRVFTNLLENSVKYADPQKTDLHVQLQVRAIDQGISICLNDNGIGISESHLQKIFERFYRVDEARTSQNGTGLGLAITKQIVEQHGGQISATSTLGLGTTMCIWLPTHDSRQGGRTDEISGS